MKKLILLLGIAMLSCNRNNETTNDDSVSIEGTWTIIKSEISYTSTGKTESSVPSGCTIKDTHEYRNGVLTSTLFSLNKSGNCEGLEVNTTKYTFDPNTMKFWFQGEEKFPYYISFVGNQMVMEDREIDRDQDGKNDILKKYFIKIK